MAAGKTGDTSNQNSQGISSVYYQFYNAAGRPTRNRRRNKHLAHEAAG
jgi:hypothetical protein